MHAQADVPLQLLKPMSTTSKCCGLALRTFLVSQKTPFTLSSLK
jgi:hypothetical protein